MFRKDFIGVRRRARTRRSEKKRKASKTRKEKENECNSESVSDKGEISTNSIETVNGVIDIDDISHDLNHRRQVGVNRRDNGLKVSEATRSDRCSVIHETLDIDSSIATKTTSDSEDNIKSGNESEKQGSVSQDIVSPRLSLSQGDARTLKEHENYTLDLETSSATKTTSDIENKIKFTSELKNQGNGTGVVSPSRPLSQGDSRVLKANKNDKSDLDTNFATKTTIDSENKIRFTNESEKQGSGTDILSPRRPVSQGDSRKLKEKENESSCEFNINEPYVPSWLDEQADSSTMDINSMRTLGILPKGLSMSLTDLRPEGGGRVVNKGPGASLPHQHHQPQIQPQQRHQQQQQRPQQKEISNGTKHVDMEKEYLKLKRRLNQRQRTDLNPRDISGNSKNGDLTVNAHARANLSDTEIPRYKELLESDELGINHFRKHIHNVKVSSKKHKRALKQMEVATNNRMGTFNNGNKRNFKFKPLYEQRHCEDALSEEPKSKTGSRS